MIGRLTRDLPGFLRQPLAADEARARVRASVEQRDQRFLDLVARTIYRHPRSPYLQLLRHAGCELGDVRAMVIRNGVDETLQHLAADGVYVTYDEMKGRRDVVRGSSRFAFDEADFDNPLNRPHLLRFTGGSGGRPSRVRYSLQFFEEWAASIAVTFEAHGVQQPVLACWWPVPIHRILGFSKLGHPVDRWFYPVASLPRPVHLAASFLALLGRLGGRRLPLPEHCDLTTPERVVGWLVDQLDAGRSPSLFTTASAGVRVGIAAARAGRDLRGASLLLGSEPMTESRWRSIEASGAQAIVHYSSVDLSGLAFACAAPTALDDMHVMLNQYAIAQRSRPSSDAGPSVDALLFTSLSTNTAKIALNAELGDYGRIERRECDCLLGQLGLTTHLSEIRSFEKLSGEGITFVRSALEQILEDALPARFGGSSVDYQLAEEEAVDGATRLVLRVDPTVGEVDEAALRAGLLDLLGGGNSVDRYQAELLRSAGSIEVRREPPLVTRAGKVLPFHLLRRSPTSATRA